MKLIKYDEFYESKVIDIFLLSCGKEHYNFNILRPDIQVLG